MALASTEAIQTIREYRNNSLFDPGPNWPEAIANERRWQQMGCDELITQIRMNPFADPVNVIEQFVLQMDRYCDVDEATYPMFKAMKDVSENIGRLFV